MSFFFFFGSYFEEQEVVTDGRSGKISGQRCRVPGVQEVQPQWSLCGRAAVTGWRAETPCLCL